MSIDVRYCMVVGTASHSQTCWSKSNLIRHRSFSFKASTATSSGSIARQHCPEARQSEHTLVLNMNGEATRKAGLHVRLAEIWLFNKELMSRRVGRSMPSRTRLRTSRPRHINAYVAAANASPIALRRADEAVTIFPNPHVSTEHRRHAILAPSLTQ